MTSTEELVVCIAGFPSVQPRFPSWLSLAERLTTVNVHSLLQKVWSGWSVGQAKQERLMHRSVGVLCRDANFPSIARIQSFLYFWCQFAGLVYFFPAFSPTWKSPDVCVTRKNNSVYSNSLYPLHTRFHIPNQKEN